MTKHPTKATNSCRIQTPFRQVVTLVILTLITTLSASGQAFTSYFTGDTSDVNPTPQFGICLMGGATEDDSAMKWFLQHANGGDMVVIRSTGSDGYNNYLYSQLGVTVNSVETIVIPSVSAANDPYVRKQVRNAEAIWIAGGNQANYINYWKNTAVDSALDDLVNVKQGVLGGTSAGMAIQGQAYYSALNNSVTSAATLANPYNSDVTIGYNDFISNPMLKGIITDTHFDNPDRKGRLMGFLARCITDYSKQFIGIACDEYTAVCIGNDQIAHVYGGHPTYDDNAYFVVPDSCLNGGNNAPETCQNGQALTWNHGNLAVKTYLVKGTPQGSNTFDLNTRKSGSGGQWKNWYVVNGVFNEGSLATPPCAPNSLTEINENPDIQVFPNPFQDHLQINIPQLTHPLNFQVINLVGHVIVQSQLSQSQTLLSTANWSPGVYFLRCGNFSSKIIK